MTNSTKIVVFMLEGQYYGIDYKFAKSIEGKPEEFTELPKSESHLKGVMDFRGKVLSVIDLKELLGITKRDVAEEHIIVVEIDGMDIGILVDKTIEIKDVDCAEIEEIPTIFGNNRIHSDGIVRSNDELITLLNIEPMFSKKWN